MVAAILPEMISMQSYAVIRAKEFSCSMC